MRQSVVTPLATAAPTNSAVGDVAAIGVSTQAARGDHLHGREAALLAEGPVIALLPGSTGTGALVCAVNTVMSVGLVSIPHRMTISQITFRATTVTVAGTLGIALFSNDGQTRLINETTANIAVAGVITHTLAAPVTLNPGLYYIAINPDGLANIDVTAQGNPAQPGANAAAAGFNEITGTVVVAASTIPATFDPDVDVTYAATQTLFARLN